MQSVLSRHSRSSLAGRRSVLVVAGLAALVSGCDADSNPPEQDPIALAVRDAVANLGSDSTEVKEKARAQIASIGDAAVPYLRAMFGSDEPDEILGPVGLVCVGTDKAFRALVEAFRNERDRDRKMAAACIRGFIEENGWSPEKVCSYPGLVDGALDYLDSGESARAAIRLAAALRLREAVPILQRLAMDTNPKVRNKATEAIKTITAQAADQKTNQGN